MASKAEATLTLESSAAHEADIIDALPYIDGITAEERKQAEELISEEVRAHTASLWCIFPEHPRTCVYQPLSVLTAQDQH